jgi:hypothetical protein
MREFRTYGSVRGALSDGRPYRDPEGQFVRSYGAIGEGLASSLVDATDGCSPMTQVDDLSRSLAAFDQNTSLVVVVEMSEASWLVAGLVAGLDRQPLKKLEPDPNALLRLLERWQAEAEKTGRTIGRVTLVYEAGRDGFWLAR